MLTYFAVAYTLLETIGKFTEQQTNLLQNIKFGVDA